MQDFLTLLLNRNYLNKHVRCLVLQFHHNFLQSRNFGSNLQIGRKWNKKVNYFGVDPALLFEVE